MPDPNSGCWLWSGGVNAKGYGKIMAFLNGEKKKLYAHRVSVELFKGPIPAEMEIDHLCRNPYCVNPDHLEIVTRSVNVSRGTAGQKGRAYQLAKTHCPQGHPYDEVNTYFYPRGARGCKKCNRITSREYMRAKRRNQI